jgi:glycosyltransferase involved in cell wall biosynthesis
MLKNNKVSLVIGTRSLVQPLTGIGHYTYNLSRALTRFSEFEISYFSGASWAEVPEIINTWHGNRAKSFVKKLVPNAYGLMRYMQQKNFNRHPKKFDLYHEPSFIPFKYHAPTVITVHDLSYLKHPESHPAERVRELSKRLPKAIADAACIITDSIFTKNELLATFNVDSNKVKAIHLGKSDDFYPRNTIETIERITKYRLNYQRYVLSVGTLEPRKNLDKLIHAYQKLPQAIAEQFPLVVVGASGWKESGILNALNKLASQNKARLLGYVPTEDLPFLYSGASVFVYPSIYEGFGLPVLEAMACGTPVIASQNTSIPEVLGDAGIMIDVNDIDVLAEKIQMICEDELARKKLSKSGLIQSAKFTWDNCAKQTVDAYHYALAH